MKTYCIIKLQHIPILILVLCFSSANSQTLEIDYFLHYSSNTVTGFINPIYNAHNVQSFSSTNVSSDSLLSKKKLKHVTMYRSFVKLDSANRFIYVEALNLAHRFQLEIDYPNAQTSGFVMDDFLQHFSSFNNDPILCKTSFKLIKSRNGKVKYTYLWNPHRDSCGLMRIRHSYFLDVPRKKDLDCGSIQQTFFNHPVTCLPASYISGFMYNCTKQNNIEMIKIDTCQSTDSAYHFAQYSKSGKKVFHCVIKFYYPYYSITRFRTEKSEQDRLTIMDQAFVWYDGRPIEYILFGRASGQVLLRTIWTYNQLGNVSKIESRRHTSDHWSKNFTEFQYIYYK